MRHTYATEMLRAGVTLVAVMKLLGHKSPHMTLRYLEITQADLQREYRLARATPDILSHPRLRHSQLLQTVLTPQESSTLCNPPSMLSKCSAALFQKDSADVSSIASPTASPKSSPRSANSTHHKNRQRLAGYVPSTSTGRIAPSPIAASAFRARS